MTQLTIDLPHSPSFRRADFIASACNEAALGAIERWPDWPQRALVLHGPTGSGKSHLAQVWREHAGGILVDGEALPRVVPSDLARCGAVALDDAERAPEAALLHLYNCCAEAGAGLLIVAREVPGRWPIGLADLASRLRAAPAVAIAAPDDALLAAVLVKHFADRQMRVAAAVIDFLVRRMERSFAAAASLADRVDRMALTAGRPVGITLARQALAEAAGQLSLPSDFAVT